MTSFARLHPSLRDPRHRGCKKAFLGSLSLFEQSSLVNKYIFFCCNPKGDVQNKMAETQWRAISLSDLSSFASCRKQRVSLFLVEGLSEVN